MKMNAPLFCSKPVAVAQWNLFKQCELKLRFVSLIAAYAVI